MVHCNLTDWRLYWRVVEVGVVEFEATFQVLSPWVGIWVCGLWQTTRLHSNCNFSALPQICRWAFRISSPSSLSYWFSVLAYLPWNYCSEGHPPEFHARRWEYFRGVWCGSAPIASGSILRRIPAIDLIDQGAWCCCRRCEIWSRDCCQTGSMNSSTWLDKIQVPTPHLLSRIDWMDWLTGPWWERQNNKGNEQLCRRAEQFVSSCSMIALVPCFPSICGFETWSNHHHSRPLFREVHRDDHLVVALKLFWSWRSVSQLGGRIDSSFDDILLDRLQDPVAARNIYRGFLMMENGCVHPRRSLRQQKSRYLP